MTYLTQFANIETIELSDTELQASIRDLQELLSETRDIQRREMIDQILEEYLEEVQWRRR